MSATEPRIRPSAVRAQQGAAVVAADHDQKACDSGSAKLGPRRELFFFRKSFCAVYL